MRRSDPSSRHPARRYSTRWEEGFSHLKHFSDREGHCRVPRSYKAADGYRLGQWVRVQRANEKRISLDRRQRLEGLAGWEWEVVAQLPKLPGPKDFGDPS